MQKSGGCAVPAAVRALSVLAVLLDQGLPGLVEAAGVKGNG